MRQSLFYRYVHLYFIIQKGIFVTRFLKQYVRHHGAHEKHGAMQKHAQFIIISYLYFKLTILCLFHLQIKTTQ